MKTVSCDTIIVSPCSNVSASNKGISFFFFHVSMNDRQKRGVKTYALFLKGNDSVDKNLENVLLVQPNVTESFKMKKTFRQQKHQVIPSAVT